MPLIFLFFSRFLPLPRLLQALPRSQATRQHLFVLATSTISALLLSSMAGGMLLLSNGPAFSPKARAATACPGGSPTPTSTPIRLNELLTNPQTDWNKDGKVESRDQWIELVNLSSSNFQMPLEVCSDAAGVVSLPATVVIPGNGFTVVYGNQFTPFFPLTQGSGQLVLLDGSGSYIDSVNYSPLGPDLSYSRHPGANGGWDITSTPTPSAPNDFTTPGSPTPTPTHTLKPTATPRNGKGGGGGSGGNATPTATPFPARSVVVPSGSALASQQDDSATDSAGDTAASSTFPSWLKIALLAVLGAGLLVVVIWYIRSWNQEPESGG